MAFRQSRARPVPFDSGVRMNQKQELSFVYFPENYRWSHGLLIGLNMAPWGGAEIGEVHRIGLRLKDHVGDDDAWFREWTQGSPHRRGSRPRAHREGHGTSGAKYLQRAAAYYHVGERFLQPKSKGARTPICAACTACATPRGYSSGRGSNMSRYLMAAPACRRSMSMPSRRMAAARCRPWCFSTASMSPRRFNITRASPISPSAASRA